MNVCFSFFFNQACGDAKCRECRVIVGMTALFLSVIVRYDALVIVQVSMEKIKKRGF